MIKDLGYDTCWTVSIKRKRGRGGRSDGPLIAALLPNGSWHNKASAIPTHPWLTCWKAHRMLSLFSFPFICTGWIQETLGLSRSFPRKTSKALLAQAKQQPLPCWAARCSCRATPSRCALQQHVLALLVTSHCLVKTFQLPLSPSLPGWGWVRVFLKHCTVSKACGYCSVYSHKSLHFWISGVETMSISFTPAISCLLETLRSRAGSQPSIDQWAVTFK